MLGDSQRQSFIHDVFLLVRGAFAAQVQTLAGWVDEIVAAPEVPGRHALYREQSLVSDGVHLLARIENICPFHPAFDAFCRSGTLVHAVSTLLGESAVLFADKINFKAPHGSNGWRPHQDQDLEWDAYASHFVTAAVA